MGELLLERIGMVVIDYGLACALRDASNRSVKRLVHGVPDSDVWDMDDHWRLKREWK